MSPQAREYRGVLNRYGIEGNVYLNPKGPRASGASAAASAPTEFQYDAEAEALSAGATRLRVFDKVRSCPTPSAQMWPVSLSTVHTGADVALAACGALTGPCAH